MSKTCTIDGCEKSAIARGWCGMHYKRWQIHGTTDRPSRTFYRPTETCRRCDCTEPAAALGCCPKHYQVLLRHGDPDYTPPTHEERFWSHVDRRNDDDCWNWTAGLKTGYGRFRAAGITYQAHRYSYILNVGPIPDGMLIDHICWNRACVNPAHLRLATQKQNLENRRGADSRSKSGVRGVFPVGSRWTAEVRSNGQLTWRGTFDTIAEADRAVREARQRIFTHSQDAVA